MSLRDVVSCDCCLVVGVDIVFLVVANECEWCCSLSFVVRCC